MMANNLWKTSFLTLAALPQLLHSFEPQEQVAAGMRAHRNASAPTQDAPAPAVVHVMKDSRIQIGGNYAYVTMKPDGHRTFHGNLGGMQAIYEYRPMNCFYAAGKFIWRQGDTDGAVGKRSILYFDGQERMGYTFAPDRKDWFWTLFTGLGFRYIDQKFTPDIGNKLHFRYNEFYVPVGFVSNYDVNSWFSIGANLTWMAQIFPTMTISSLHGARWTLKKTLVNFYAELPLTFGLPDNNTYQLTITPFYEHWQDGHSTAKLSNGVPLGIPRNTYNFYGVELNFGFCF